MKEYHLVINNDLTGAPDFDYWTLANNKDEAMDIFLKLLNRNDETWDSEMIKDLVEEYEKANL